MIKAVFRPNELQVLEEKVVIESPTSYPDLAQYAPVEEEIEEMIDIDEYTGPTADDLRREAEMFKAQWEQEKERMTSGAKEEAERIVQDAQEAAFSEIKRKTDEGLVIKQQAEAEAERIIADAQVKASELEFETRQNLETERKEARENGKEDGRKEGFAEGKAEVDRLIERTQTILERAQDKRAEILAETEQEIVDLVLLITRKVVKIISEKQKGIVASNVVQALRKVKSKGDIIIRVNIADLKLATEHKEEFIRLMEGAKSLQIMEDSTVDVGGCIIETDFGEIDARISSQLAELESKILEVSPIRWSAINDNMPPPVIRTTNLEADLEASKAMLESSEDIAEAAAEEEKREEEPERDLSPGENAALTASAALAALATMSIKGKRKGDRRL